MQCPGYFAAAQAITSGLSAVFEPTLAIFVSTGMTSITAGADERTPMAMPNPSADRACWAPDGISANATSSP